MKENELLLFRALRNAGIPSDVFYAASAGSIGASIAVWAIHNRKDAAHAERFGIFVGLWAPTFMLIGHGLHALEVEKGYGSASMNEASDHAEVAGTRVREAVGANE